MTDDQIDYHLDAILRVAGSRLRHYSFDGTQGAMRAAMRAFEAAAGGSPTAVALRDMQITALRAELQRARGLLEAWDALDFEECETDDGLAVLIDQHEFDSARAGLDEFLRPPRDPDSDDPEAV